MSEPTIHEVSKDLTRPREQMNTHQAKHETALDRFHADMDKRDRALDRFRANMSKNESAFERLQTDMAKQEKYRMQWLIGIWIGGVLVTITVLGLFIRLAI